MELIRAKSVYGDRARVCVYAAAVCAMSAASIETFPGSAVAAERPVSSKAFTFSGREHLLAASTTAMAITGDVWIAPTYIEFSTRKRLSIRYLRDVPGTVSYVGDGERTASAQLYRVLSSADPTLLAGNRFCGRPSTFVTILRRQSSTGTDVVLTAYSSATAPNGKASDAMCAGYDYTLARSRT